MVPVLCRTEAEIQSWGRGDGNVLLCEYVSATNGPEILESANDKSGLHSKSKSKSIHPSLYSSSAPGSLEIGSGLHQPSDSSNGNKGAKGNSILIQKIKIALVPVNSAPPAKFHLIREEERCQQLNEPKGVNSPCRK